jgi:hypothetical protein
MTAVDGIGIGAYLNIFDTIAAMAALKLPEQSC